jgi:acetoin:2,6-dichlorophenolindophenol oxidoreductase subunit beta
MRENKQVNYKDQLKKSMETMAEDKDVCFIGYGVKIGGRAMGTLTNISDEQLIETPVSENLMVGAGIGMSLSGRKPVVFIERMDFILNCSDAIVNHLDKINSISGGEYNPTMILRVVVGNKNKALFTGTTHTQDFSDAFSKMLSFPVVKLTDSNMIEETYVEAYNNLNKHSTMIVEYKDYI